MTNQITEQSKVFAKTISKEIYTENVLPYLRMLEGASLDEDCGKIPIQYEIGGHMGKISVTQTNEKDKFMLIGHRCNSETLNKLEELTKQ